MEDCSSRLRKLYQPSWSRAIVISCAAVHLLLPECVFDFFGALSSVRILITSLSISLNIIPGTRPLCVWGLVLFFLFLGLHYKGISL